jgi:hypothetical protein
MGIVSDVISGVVQSESADAASDAQTQAADRSLDLYEKIYNQNRQDMAPFRDLNYQQANAFGEIFGFNPVGTPGINGSNPANAFAAGYGPRDHVYGQNTPYATMGDGGGYADRSYSGRPVQNGSQNVAQRAAGQAAGQPQGNPAMARFQESPFGTLLENDLYNTREDLNNAFSAQGLMFSSANDYAQAEATSRLQSDAFQRYVASLMGSPPSGAVTQSANQANMFANQSANAFNQYGNAQAAGSLALGNNWVGTTNAIDQRLNNFAGMMNGFGG